MPLAEELSPFRHFAVGPQHATEMGTVKSSLTLRPIARCSANLRWESEVVRPQTRQS